MFSPYNLILPIRNQTEIELSSEVSNSNGLNAFLEKIRKANIYSIIAIVVVGLISNFLTLILFLKKEFRTSPSHVYLWCLALVDSLFLISHFTDDTIKDLNSANNLVNLLNIIDKFDLMCRMVNYLKYVTRFISSFIVFAFIFQRLHIVYRPLSNQFRTKISAWNSILVTSFTGLFINLWTLFMFQINGNFCDVNKRFRKEYFYASILFTLITTLVPIVIIFILNLFIISKTLKDVSKMKKERKSSLRSLQNISINSNLNKNVLKSSSIDRTIMNKSVQIKPHYLTYEHILNRKTKNKLNYSKKVTFLLVLISYVFILLNLPYMITWSIYFYEINFNLANLDYQLLRGVLEITEVLHILNYGVKFFLYFLSCTIFRSKLQYASN